MEQVAESYAEAVDAVAIEDRALTEGYSTAQATNAIVSGIEQYGPEYIK